MQMIEIGEVCEVYDGPHATPKKTSDGPIYLGIDAITDEGKINPMGYSYLSEDDFLIWTKRVTPKYGDLVFSYEATLGRYALIPKGFHGCLGRRLAVVRPKDERINIKWLYYFFLSPAWKAFIDNNTVKGSTVNRISIEDFPKFKIPLIDRLEQDRIVNALSVLDDKIDNNIAINDNLEQQIKYLYNYWFLQYNFPNQHNMPYKSSGGKIIYNNQLKKGIPENWAVVSLNTLCDILSGYSFQSNDYVDNGKYRLITIKNVQDSGVNLNVDNYINILPTKLPDYCILKPENILMSLTGNVARVGLMYDNNCLLNQRVALVKPKKAQNNSFLYALFKSDTIRITLEGLAIGTSQKNLSPIDAGNISIPYNESVVSAFSDFIEAKIKQIVRNSSENLSLCELRDWLLPILMNGQATIDD